MKNKRIISFEGIDFSGKSTQIELLREYLSNNKIKYKILREPGSSIIGEKIRDILLDKKHLNMNNKTELLLYCAARTQLIAEQVKPLLEEGYLIILDRFFDSTMAYQGYGRGLDRNFLELLNQFVTDQEKYFPQVTFYLEISLLEYHQRKKLANRGQDRIEALNNHFFENVIDGYNGIAAKFPKRVVKLAGQEAKEKIFKQIIQTLTTRGMF